MRPDVNRIKTGRYRPYTQNADMAKLVAAPVLGTGVERRAGSSPAIRTICLRSSTARAFPYEGKGWGLESLRRFYF